ncbi:MAG: P-loop NTPase fold protein [Verrucomicrobiota bacterium]
MAEKNPSPGSKPPLLTLLSDHPITSSGEGSADMLGLHERLCAPLDILRHPGTRTPFTIALYGDWGTGKTSAMRWLHSQLLVWNDSPVRDKATQPHLTPVWFYPWKYHKREDVWRGIIAEVILESLRVNPDADLPHRIAKAGKQFGKFLGNSFLHALSNIKIKAEVFGTGAEISGRVFQDIADEYNQTARPHAPFLNDFETQLTEWVKSAFDDKTHRLVLFIDDLDRCMPDVALEVLEALKLYLNIPGLLFVAGLDRGVIDQIVTEHYKTCGVEGKIALRYLDKLFQVEIDVAPSQTKVSAFLDQKIEQLDRATGSLWSQSLSAGLGGDHDYRKIIENSVRRLGRHNPRDFTRILNSLLIVSHAALTSTPEIPDQLDHDSEKALRFAQGGQVYLLRRLLHDYTAKAENLLRTEPGQSWLERLSHFRRENPTHIPYDKNKDLQRKLGEEEIAKLRAEENAETPERKVASLIEESRTLEDGTGAFDALYQHGWDLLLIPFSPSVAAAMPQEKKLPGSTPKLPGVDDIPEEILAAIARDLEIPISEVTREAVKNVTGLDLSGTQVSDLTALKSLSRLQFLYLIGTPVSDITALKSLTSLESLDLEHTQVSDLTALKSLTSLQSLDLRGSQVSDLTPLKNLTSLHSLYLMYTQVNDLSPLYGLKDCLRILCFSDTPAAQDGKAMEALREALPYTEIDG